MRPGSRIEYRVTLPRPLRKAVMLMGGLDGIVHYNGIGLVRYGAEKTAKIHQMAASASPAGPGTLIPPMQHLCSLVSQTLVA